MDAKAKFNQYCKVLSALIALQVNCEVEIVYSNDGKNLLNVLVVDATKAKEVARIIRKSKKLRLTGKAEYPSTELGELPSTVLVYAEAA